MSDRKKALIAGATGVVGRNLLRHLLTLNDWDVIAVSRRKPDVEGRYEHVAVDLLDRAQTFEALKRFAPSARADEVIEKGCSRTLADHTSCSKEEKRCTPLRSAASAAHKTWSGQRRCRGHLSSVRSSPCPHECDGLPRTHFTVRIGARHWAVVWARTRVADARRAAWGSNCRYPHFWYFGNPRRRGRRNRPDGQRRGSRLSPRSGPCRLQRRIGGLLPGGKPSAEGFFSNHLGRRDTDLRAGRLCTGRRHAGRRGTGCCCKPDPGATRATPRLGRKIDLAGAAVRTRAPRNDVYRTTHRARHPDWTFRRRQSARGVADCHRTRGRVVRGLCGR